MKKWIAILMAGIVSAASAVSLISTDFSAGYSSGDITQNAIWSAMPNTGTQAFSVNPSAPGTAATAPFSGSFNTVDGNYVYMAPSDGLGNTVDDEWTGAMDFTLSSSATNAAQFGSHEIFNIGLTAAATNKLNNTGNDPAHPGDVHMNLRINNGDELWVTIARLGRFRTLGAISLQDIGWPTNSTSALLSDKLHLDWTIRKTRNEGYYSATATISNTVSGLATVFDSDYHQPAGVNLDYVYKTNAYNSASMTLAMGHDGDADDDGTRPLIDISLESLSVDQTSGNVPVLDTPVVMTEGANTLVTLSWPLVIDATGYKIERATTPGGPYTVLVASTNGLAYLDTDVVNGTEYYYLVTASSAGASDASSIEVAGVPLAAATGSVLDTTFIVSEGYTEGNLSGQKLWKDALAAGNPTFSITDSGGAGFADSAPQAGNFNTALGNDIYSGNVMSNNVGDEFYGSLTFSITAPISNVTQVIRDVYTDNQQTNSLGSFTNFISNITGSELLKFGITSDPDTGLDDNQPDDMMFYVRLQSSGRMDINAMNTANAARIWAVPAADLGWDPNWEAQGADAINGPDVVTDPITINWFVRKTAQANTYLTDVDVIANGMTNSSSWAVSDKVAVHPFATDLYGASLVHLGLGIDDNADKCKTNGGSGIEYEGPVRTVAIDTLSLDKADNQPPSLIVPDNFAGDVSSGQVVLSWLSVPEADSYVVRSYSDFTGGTATVIANTVALTETVTGLTDGASYFFTVAADFGIYGESAETEMIVLRPLGKELVVDEGVSALKAGVKFVNPTTYTENTISGIINRVGAGSDGSILQDGVNNWNASSVHALLQLRDGVNTWFSTGRGIRGFDGDGANGGVVSPDFVRIRLNESTGYSSSLAYTETPDFVQGVPFSILGAETFSYEVVLQLNVLNGNSPGYNGGVRAAIRNGADDWYASNTEVTTAGAHQILDMGAETWALIPQAGLNSTALMTVTNASFSTAASLGLNNITAVGYFADHVRGTDVQGWSVTKGATATPLQLYMDGFNLYNAAADANADPDDDGMVNVHEWGTMGDPGDPANTGRITRQLGVDETGSNLLYVYPRLESDSRPTYTVLDTSNLVFVDFDVAVGVVEVGAGPWNPANPGLGLEAVTNLIPIDVNAKFIGLEISE